MSNKAMLFKKISELDFAIHELKLYLDTHQKSKKALDLINKFRKLRREAVENYEENYGKLIVTSADAGKDGKWDWINGPWPWEKDFMEV